MNALKDALRRNPGISKQLRTPGVNATAAVSAAVTPVAAGAASFHPIYDEIFERFASRDDADGCAIRPAKSKLALGKSGAGTHLRFVQMSSRPGARHAPVRAGKKPSASSAFLASA